MDRNMQARIAFAVVAIPTAFAVVWLGGWALVALLTVAGVLGTRELFAFARVGSEIDQFIFVPVANLLSRAHLPCPRAPAQLPEHIDEPRDRRVGDDGRH